MCMPVYDFSKSHNRSLPYEQPHSGVIAQGNSTSIWLVTGGGKNSCRCHMYWAEIHKTVSKLQTPVELCPIPHLQIETSSWLPRNLVVKIVHHFLLLLEILISFPATGYVTVSCPVKEMMEVLVALLKVDGQIHFSFVGVIDGRRLQFGWRQHRGRRFVAVKQRDVKNIVLLDHIRTV